MAIPREDITGLVLAGGRGSRMGGTDKGLQPLAGRPLVQHAIERLRPQVGLLLVNANRNLDAYAAFGHPVLADALADYPGPLAGMLAGLERCRTPWLVTVPCDTPHFPADLVRRLADEAAASGAEIVLPVTHGADGMPQPQPVFCLLQASLADSLRRFLQQGQRKIDRWTALHRERRLPFAEAEAFANANTREELAALETPSPPQRG